MKNLLHTNAAYRRMEKVWQLSSDLRGGTAVMRAHCKRWLPEEPKEEPDAYRSRVARSVLVNYYKSAIEHHTARPFSRAVTTTKEESLPDDLRAMLVDIDRMGTDLTNFGRMVYESALYYGVVHVLVDYPKQGEATNLAEAEQRKVRPYCVLVEAPRLFYWAYNTVDGRRVLSEIRIREDDSERADAEGNIKYYARVRVLTRDDWKVYEAEKTGDAGEDGFVDASTEWTVIESGSHTFGEIPLRTMYFKKLRPMEAEPPLEDMAWLNLIHFQSMSDQRNILRYSRMGIMFIKGVTKSERAGWTLGANVIWAAEDTQADAKWTEQNGKPIEMGRQDLKDLEEQLEVFGMMPLVQRVTARTATGVMSDDSRADCELMAWVEATNSFLRELVVTAGRWLGVTEISDEFKITIYSDFSYSLRTVDETRALIEARKAREISRETFLTEMRRRQLISANVDIDEEMGRLDAESSLEPPDPADDPALRPDDDPRDASTT